MLAAPIKMQAKIIGIIEAVHSRSDGFNAADVQLLEAAASWVAIAIQNAQLFAQVQNSQKRISRLARRVINAQEQERLRVSRELHDEAGQALIALKLSLQSIQDKLPTRLDSTRGELVDAIALTDEMMDRMRFLAHNLRPQIVESLGLNSSLEGLCRDFAGRSQLSIEYQGADLPQLPDPVAISFYRFLQEGLTNIAKHAAADQVQVELKLAEGVLSLSITDNGSGFSPENHLKPFGGSSGIGLAGIRERFELLGGWVLIESQPGNGTRIIAHAPVQAESLEGE
jgi:signal transduction histidine kinase